MVEFISQPWAWYVAGPILAVVMFLLVYFGKNFGLSANLRTMCSIGGAGKVNDFFRFEWKAQRWNLVFVIGAILGGFLATQFLGSDQPILLAESTIESLEGLGFENAGEQYLPAELFSLEQVFTLKGLLILVIGGFLVGFGSRYAGGCTSGHAISGLSNLQLPSLIAVIGFFIGGLIMSFFILPWLF
jgi:uncharacterized protein